MIFDELVKLDEPIIVFVPPEYFSLLNKTFAFHKMPHIKFKNIRNMKRKGIPLEETEEEIRASAERFKDVQPEKNLSFYNDDILTFQRIESYYSVEDLIKLCQYGFNNPVIYDDWIISYGVENIIESFPIFQA